MNYSCPFLILDIENESPIDEKIDKSEISKNSIDFCHFHLVNASGEELEFT